MTTFTVMDVGHGSCCYLIADNSNLMMFDCGQKSAPESRPSVKLTSLGHVSVELLVITNYDEDHISDILNLREKFDVKQLRCNKSINVKELRDLKLKQSGEISSAMESLIDMIENYTGGPINPAPEFPNVNRQHFQNNHPFSDGDDTNNISVVTILDVHDECFLIPGDIEKEGWFRLLESDPLFRSKLSDITVFIASHHGRINGYCEDLFTKYNCRPKVFVFSDDNIKYSTQESADLYRQWASGTNFNDEIRKIFTTRKDGSLTWSL